MKRLDGKPPTVRAGRRKCGRCKVVWNRVKGDVKKICLRCRDHCKRCDNVLNEYDKEVGGRSGSYSCRTCVVEVTTLSQRKNDPDGHRRRDWKLVNEYGITSVEYDAILKDQGGACWICNMVPTASQRRLSVDHLHSKGEKQRNPRERRGRCRGLLCWHCNAALGKFGDSVTKLRRAADYLEAWPAQKILKKEDTSG